MPKMETQSNNHSLVSLQETTVANAEIIVGPLCVHTSYRICFVEPDGFCVLGELCYV
jgi:hypothetical protein